MFFTFNQNYNARVLDMSLVKDWENAHDNAPSLHFLKTPLDMLKDDCYDLAILFFVDSWKKMLEPSGKSSSFVKECSRRKSISKRLIFKAFGIIFWREAMVHSFAIGHRAKRSLNEISMNITLFRVSGIFVFSYLRCNFFFYPKPLCKQEFGFVIERLTLPSCLRWDLRLSLATPKVANTKLCVGLLHHKNLKDPLNLKKPLFERASMEPFLPFHRV